MYYLNLEELIKEGENQVTEMMKSESSLFEESQYGGRRVRQELRLSRVYENFSTIVSMIYDKVDDESVCITYVAYDEYGSLSEDTGDVLIRIIYEISFDHFKTIQESIVENDDKFSFFSNTSINKDDNNATRYNYVFRKATNEKGEVIPEIYEMIFDEGNKMSIEIVNPRTRCHGVSGYLMISEQLACDTTITFYAPDIDDTLESIPYIFATNKDLIESIIRGRVETKREDLNGESEPE